MTRLFPRHRCAALVVLALTAAQACRGQSPPPQQPDGAVEAITRRQVIEAVLKRLNDAYVFPDTAGAMEKSLRERQERGEYEKITSARALADVLTKDLGAISNDKHLRVRYVPDPIPAHGSNPKPSALEKQAAARALAWMNHGFNKVERLPGNIGYIEFEQFYEPEFAGPTLAAAMNFLADSDALIIDLRRNRGGEPEMVALVCSYLFDATPIHLNDLYWREGNRTQQFWTLRTVPGKRFLKKDVYVLTSKYTFSGAEECAYNLKNLQRALIVGETTGGGAHPGSDFRVHEHFQMFVPTGRAINPITKTNWEGVGVKPDIDVPMNQALLVARLMALKKSLPILANPDFKAEVQEEIEELQKELNQRKAKVQATR